MIPTRKKTTEEIAALREGLGIPPTAPAAASLPPPPAPIPEVLAKKEEAQPEPVASPAAPNTEPVIHLDLPPMPTRREKAQIKPTHSLRKHEVPLTPAPTVTHKTALPSQRNNPSDIAQIRKREALAAIQHKHNADPAAYLRSLTASPFLIGPGYLLAIAASTTVYLRFHYITPAALLALATAILLFIALRKPRSRHHAALLFIVVFLTLVFGALYYAPLLNHGS